MPTAIEFVLAPEDEKQFLAFIAPYELTMYPSRIPPGYKPLVAKPDVQPLLTEPAYYFAAEQLGPVSIHTIKKGKDRGWMIIDETNSPVIHFDRSIYDEENQLRSGKLWTELNITGDMQRNWAYPESYRRMWMQMREWLVGKCRRSDPSGYVIGPQAARLSKAGTILREQGRKGCILKPYK
jgi:hypothetical protein